MWIDALKAHFSPGVRARADDYARRVEVVEQDARSLHAHVRGSDDYCLHVRRDGHRLEAGCSCPYFEQNGPCKHLWAVLQYAHRLNLWLDPPAIVDLDDLDSEAPRQTPPPRKPRQPDWRNALALLRVRSGPVLEPGAELLYILDVAASIPSGDPVIEVVTRARKRDGGWGKPKALALDLDEAARLPPEDRELVALIAALAEEINNYYGYGRGLPKRATLPLPASASLVGRIAATGRLHLRLGDELLACPWLGGAPYAMALRLVADGAEVILRGEWVRQNVARPLGEALVLVPGGAVFFRDHAAPVDAPPNGGEWLRLLAERRGELRVPAAEAEALVEELHGLADAPPLELPESLRVEERRVAPQPWLLLRSRSDGLSGELRFDYGGAAVEAEDPRARVRVARISYVRDREAEARAASRLRELGLRYEFRYPDTQKGWQLAQKRLAETARALVAEGWRVDIEGKPLRAPREVEVDVVSGIDWFDLNAEVSYGGDLRASLPALLKAQRHGGWVRLGDGSLGLLPEEWLARHRLVAQVGAVDGDSVRFKRAQIGLLDALLSAMPEARGDAGLQKARAAFARFEGVRAQEPPRGFVGTLRGYQREGLGWLSFLRDFGFGGCLADDMGLGKTIQALALLASRPRKRPSIAVVPKSLMFNWRREAARFTPKLRVYEHHGTERSLAHFRGQHLIVTTYGTLVRDIGELRKLDFDYVILDEAQAIKNPRTESARAARLLSADHRLVLTGTPVENRLADLWSLFEFLNPGMLGSAEAFKGAGGREVADDAARVLLARALRPFILRRTKEQVARDLPAKTEQVIYCELEGGERKKYDELRAYYRATLLGLVDKQGMAGAKMHILEALLRLRQAACHPGLVDRDQAGEKSAKLTALLEQLDEVVQGGHKALVFSQFTTLLGIVKRHLDQAGITYEYLDGRTRDRQAKVDRFQADPGCPVFLVSLRAGGVGLNLTAAEYVFLLDPWWNPAVESQAIDRTHRIGQSRAVFAYRLIGRDTIEEKVLALQAQKKRLAEAIITADNSFLAGIGREELELLLS